MDISILVCIAFLLLLLQGLATLLRTLLRPPVTFPPSIPVVGVRKQFLSVARASIRQLTNGITTLLEGYRKASLRSRLPSPFLPPPFIPPHIHAAPFPLQHAVHNKPYIVYDPSAHQELLVPPQHIKWITSQPDTLLSSHGVRQERHAVRYLHMGIEYHTTMQFIERICGERLTRNLEKLQAPMHDELSRCIDAVFGAGAGDGGDGGRDEAWTEICVYQAMEEIVMPTMSRVFLGLPLCRDPRILVAFRRYILALGAGTIFVGELPGALKGLVARAVKVPLAWYRRKTLEVLVPVVERQMREGFTVGEGEEGDGEGEEAYFVKHCAKVSEKSVVGGLGRAAGPEVVAEWIMSLGFAGSSSTVIQATNLLLDLASCPASATVPQLLRTEAASLLPDRTAWTQACSFKQQVLADSAIRESLRYHPILIKGLTREVVPEAGMQLPDGTHMPQGAWVGVPVLGVHRDERFYREPEVYRPFRYVRGMEAPRDAGTKAVGEAGDDEKRGGGYEDELEAGRPTATYLGFGYGRHACPGRWFAVLMLKMIVAYVTLHYDIEATGPVPKMRVVGDAVLPPMSATIRVRRRRAGE